MTYVLADIHGRADRFHEILERIGWSGSDTLFILGDVVDRNPDGIALLEEILATDNMHMLLGNHEYMMLASLADPDAQITDWCTNRGLWYLNGGAVTEKAFYALPETRQARILAYLKSLPLNIPLTCAGKRWLLAHGAPASHFVPGDPDFPDETYYAVWYRFDPFRETFDPDATLICGHTPTAHFNGSFPMTVVRRKNVICIDCGCAYPAADGGRLACICLETDEVVYSTIP